MASAASSRNPKDTFVLKQKAMKYYHENGIPSKMEEILNTMFYEDPPDVHGYLVNYFSQFTKPAVVEKFCATQVFDSAGMPTIQTDVLCTINNMEKRVVSTTIPFTNIKSKPEEREKSEVDVQNSVTAALRAINSEISHMVKGIDPKQQAEIDKLLLSAIEKLKLEEATNKTLEEEPVEDPTPPLNADEKDKKTKSAKTRIRQTSSDEAKGGKMSAPLTVVPDRPLEVFPSGSEAVAAVSQAVCACAAVANNIPIYRHVAKLARTSGALHEFRIPLPMVTIIQSGRHVPGKVNCVKDYMLVPGVTMPVDKSIEHIQQIFHYVAKSFASKLGPSGKFVNESGALCPQLETPTQALDLLQEAVNAQGLTIGEDMYLAINACGHDFFDHDKGRYEVVTGSFKAPDDMVEFWTDIVHKYPALIAIIDPMRGEDIDQWMSLAERVSESLFVMGDRFYTRPGLVVAEPPAGPAQTSGAVLYLEQMNSISDLIKCANLMHELKNEVVISTNQGETTDTFIVDLAVGLNARFLKVGGPSRGERSCKLNRLVQISQELEPPTQSEQEMSPEANVGADTEKDLDDAKEDDPKTNMEDLQLDIGQEEQVEGKISDRGEEAAKEHQEVEKPPLWGDNEKSCLKLHDTFVFPLLEKPPLVEESEREGEEKASSLKSGK